MRFFLRNEKAKGNAAASCSKAAATAVAVKKRPLFLIQLYLSFPAQMERFLPDKSIKYQYI